MKVVLMCLCCTLVHIPSIIMRYEPVKDTVSKNRRRTLFITYAVALIIDMLLCCLVWYFGKMSVAFYKYNTLVFSVVLSVVNSIILRHRVREHFFTFGLAAIVVYLMMSVTAYVQDKLPHTDTVWMITTNAGILYLLFIVFYPILNKLMQRIIAPFLSADTPEYLKIIWFVPTAMFLAGLFSFPMNEYITTPLQLVSRLLIGVATLFICRNVSYDYAQLRKYDELSQSLNRQKEYYAALSEKVENARKLRHDFKHHTTAMKALANNNDYQALSEYINELSELSVTWPFVPFTGNSAADGIIYHYVLLCNKENITLEIEGMLKDVQVSDIDLCVLLGNALDNAYEACKTIESDRFIHLSFNQKDMLTITVQNSFDGIMLTKNNTILSRKRNNAPGIGLSSMRDICEKYNGTMRTNYDNNVFSVMLLLN